MPRPDLADAVLSGARPLRVLVTGAGGPAAVAFLRAVTTPGAFAAALPDGSSGAGVRVEAYAVDIDPYAAGLYLVPPERRALVPRGEDPTFLAAVLDLCRAAAVDVVVPTVDTELPVVCGSRPALRAVGATVLGPTPATLERCLDKADLASSCGPLGVVPATAVVDGGLATAGWGWWPAVAKPRRGSGGRDVTVVAGPAELARLPTDGTWLVQELLPGPEHSIDVLATTSGRVVAAVPRSRLKVDSGVAVAGRTVDDPELVGIGHRVAAAIGLTSVANVQVKADAAGRPRLLEVNPRFPGTMPLTVAAGVDMPVLSVADLLGVALPDQVSHSPAAVVRHWEEVLLGPDELGSVRPGFPTPAGTRP